MIKNYTYEINGQEDYKMAIHEIEVLEDTYGITNVSSYETYAKGKGCILIRVEVIEKELIK